MTHPLHDRPSTPSLIGEAIRQSTALFTTEIALVRLEATEKLTLALVSVASIGAAAVFLIVALIFLLQGVVELLVAKGFPAFQASFMIGGGIALFAALAVIVAIRNLSATRLRPSRSLAQYEAAKKIVKGTGL